MCYNDDKKNFELLILMIFILSIILPYREKLKIRVIMTILIPLFNQRTKSNVPSFMSRLNYAEET